MDNDATPQPTAEPQRCLLCCVPITENCGCIPFAALQGTLGVELIKYERGEHVLVHGYGTEHDDDHFSHELTQAARAYLWHILTEEMTGRRCKTPPPGWPFERQAFKPTNPVRALIVAGSWIAAELDRRARKNPDEFARLAAECPTRAQS